MCQRKSFNARGPRRQWPLRSSSSPPRSKFLRCNVASDKQSGFLIAGFLSILAVCLASGFVAVIVIEAFDSDTDLWPLGAEDFTLAPHDSPVVGGRSVGVFPALSLMHRFIDSAGAHLVVGHRARSTLPADNISVSISVNLAEPWGPSLYAAPALGHFVSYARTFQRKVRRARRGNSGGMCSASGFGFCALAQETRAASVSSFRGGRQ